MYEDKFFTSFHKALTSAVGGQLNAGDFDQFISAIKDQSLLLSRISFMPLQANVQDIHTIDMAVGQGQVGTEDTQETTASFTLPVNTITAGELVVDAPVTYQFLEDQIWSQAEGPEDLDAAVAEGLGLIQNELLKYTANEIAREGASTSSAGFTDSLIDVATQDANVVDIQLPFTGSSTTLSGSMKSFFATASLGLSDGTALNDENTVYIVSRNHHEQYRRELEDTSVNAAFNMTLDGGRLSYQGRPVDWYPNWPDRHIMLTNYDNLVWGVRKNIKLESDRNINLRRFDNVLSARAGFGIKNSADVVLIHFIG